MFILCKAIRFLTGKVRKGRRSVAHSSDDEPRKERRSVARKDRRAIAHSSDKGDNNISEYEAAWSLQRTAKEYEHIFYMDHVLPELKKATPALVDDDDVPHMLAGAESDEYDHDHFGFEYMTEEPHLSVVCESSNTEKNVPLLKGARSWDFSKDLSEDCFLESMQPEPPHEEDILETYLRNKREFVALLAVDNRSSSSLKKLKKRKQVTTTGPMLEAALTQMIFEPSTFHHRRST
jgi:hypothetical protein